MKTITFDETKWKLVPVEPTEEMLNAACQDGVCVEGRPVWKHSTAFQAKWKYQQMLSASPSQEPAQEMLDITEADVWHEGSKSFYRAMLLHKLTPGEVFSGPPELDVYTKPAQEVTLTDERLREIDDAHNWQTTEGRMAAYRTIIAALSEKAVPAVPQCIPAQEVIDAIEAWKSAWLKVPPFGNKVNKTIREAITFSHNSLFMLLHSAQQAQRMPAGCTTPPAAATAAPSQPSKYGSPELQALIVAHATQEPVTLTDRQFDLICQAIDKADTITMDGDYMMDSDDCIGVVRVMQALFSITALREKEGK